MARRAGLGRRDDPLAVTILEKLGPPPGFSALLMPAIRDRCTGRAAGTRWGSDATQCSTCGQERSTRGPGDSLGPSAPVETDADQGLRRGGPLRSPPRQQDPSKSTPESICRRNAPTTRQGRAGSPFILSLLRRASVPKPPLAVTMVVPGRPGPGVRRRPVGDRVGDGVRTLDANRSACGGHNLPLVGSGAPHTWASSGLGCPSGP